MSWDRVGKGTPVYLVGRGLDVRLLCYPCLCMRLCRYTSHGTNTWNLAEACSRWNWRDGVVFILFNEMYTTFVGGELIRLDRG